MQDLLNLSGLRFISVRAGEGTYFVRAEELIVPTICSHCKSSLLYRHNSQIQSFADCPTDGWRTVIEIDRKRYRCAHCFRISFEPLPEIDEKRQATTRLVRDIERRCFKETRLSLSRDVGLGARAIRDIFDAYSANLAQTVKIQTPRYLGITELKLRGEYCCALINIEKITLFDVLLTREKQFFADYFQRLPDRHLVEWVAMDMREDCRQVIKYCLPETRIIVDPIFLERLADAALEKFWTHLRKGVSKSQQLKLKDARRILLKRQRNLSVREREVLKKWDKDFPSLAAAYMLKEEFFGIWEFNSRTDGETAYLHWRSIIPAELRESFGGLVTAVDSWFDEFFNYFDHPIGNAYKESVNNLAVAMNQIGQRFDLEVIRARLLYGDRRGDVGSEVIRKPLEESADSGKWAFFNTEGIDPLTGTGRKIVEYESSGVSIVTYGRYIPDLLKLLHQGHFE